MKSRAAAVFCILSLSTASFGANKFEVSQRAVVLKMGTGAARVQVWSDRILRVTYVPAGRQLPDEGSLAVIAKPQDVAWNETESEDDLKLTTDSMRALIDRKSGDVQFWDDKEKEFLAEAPRIGRTMTPITVGDQASFKIKQVFLYEKNEALYGLGQHQDGWMNLAGKKVHLQQENRLVGIPVLVSSRGYGILWDNPSITDVASRESAQNPKTTEWSSEVGDAIDYYVMWGPEIDQVIAGYRYLTGTAPMFGKWAWGFWQSKERYASQDELLWIVDQYRSRHIPIDGIVQDWQYWSPGPWGSHKLDPARYYKPAEMVKKLHDQNIHMLISVWAKFDLDGKNYRELADAGVLYPRTLPSVFPKGQQRWYDAFSAKGRDLYWKQISTNLFSLGIDGWWLDATEPELGGRWGEFRDFKTADGPGAKVFNAYPLMTTSAVYQGQRAENSDKRVMILTRSAYAGQQRNAAITWSGDIDARWEVFAKQIPAGLNFCMTGIPYWNTDIGGFFGSNPDDPKYRELFTRWFQFGAFCPLFRVHGTDQPKEMWRFDPETFKILLTYDKLRYRFLPYIYSTAWSVTHDDLTMMRGLVFDFRTDPNALDIGDQFMFGRAIMVNPVTKAGATTRPVYLPAGIGSFDFWTGKSYSGGQTISAAAPIETMPLFVRAGSIIPMGPAAESAMEKSSEPLEIRVYPGRDAAFNLYDDEGDNYDYEKGMYSVIPIYWNDAKKVLTIGDRQGQFPGMQKERRFRVIVVREGVGAGAETAPKADAEVNYQGTAKDTPMGRG
jgi:alpha-D-xyloside xylohydrolase